MQEKTYLKWYNKLGYGSGDIAGNVVYVLLSAFMLVYLTDTVGLNPGIVGTLMLLARVLDGITDVVFGALIDKTKSRMGKARPWMFWGYFGCAITLIALFAIPTQIGEFAQYAWFFVAYVLLNSVFYTANNIAYSALTALITKNGAERVQMGSIRFMFAFATNLLIQAITIGAVESFGGGAEGWRTMAIVYAVVGLAVNSLSVLSVRELRARDLMDRPDQEAPTQAMNLQMEHYSPSSAARLLVTNKYYLLILAVFILMQLFSAMVNTTGIFFMTYLLGDPGLLGTFALALNGPLVVALAVTPLIVKRVGAMYGVNLWGYVIAVLGRVGVIAAGYAESVPLMLLFTAVASLGMAPLQGTLNALIAEASEYTYLRTKQRIDGTLYSATSLGVKVGGGLGTALAGWLLAWAQYDGMADVQPDSVITMLHVMYLWLPAAFNVVILVLLRKLDVERVNRRLREELEQQV